MPYIKQNMRPLIDSHLDELRVVIHSPGELNYATTRLVLNYLASDNSPQGYYVINEVIGALECAKLEFYRRLVIPYEDMKINQNGDVYPFHFQKTETD